MRPTDLARLAESKAVETGKHAGTKARVDSARLWVDAGDAWRTAGLLDRVGFRGSYFSHASAAFRQAAHELERAAKTLDDVMGAT